MSGVNRVTILGRLGQEPDTRYLANGDPVCTLSVATSINWQDKTTGERREKTEWHRCVCFGRTADIAAKYLAKGRQVYLEGRLQTRKWQGQDGSDRYTTEIVVENLHLVGSRPDQAAAGNGQANGQAYGQGQPAAAANGRPAPSEPAQPPAANRAPPAGAGRPAAPTPPAAGPDDFDYDIPF